MLEVLLDLSDGSRKELILVKDTALEYIRKEIEHHYQEPEIQLCCGNPDVESTGPKYVLQRWSSKWSEHVDVLNSEAIKTGDKLRVLPKSTVSCTCSTYITDDHADKLFVLQPKGSLKSVVSTCSELATPKKEHAQYLSALFPGSFHYSKAITHETIVVHVRNTQDFPSRFEVEGWW